MLDLDNVFTYHAPKDGQPARYEAIRAKAKELAALIQDTTPASREQSVALTNVQQAVHVGQRGHRHQRVETTPPASASTPAGVNTRPKEGRSNDV